QANPYTSDGSENGVFAAFNDWNSVHTPKSSDLSLHNLAENVDILTGLHFNHSEFSKSVDCIGVSVTGTSYWTNLTKILSGSWPIEFKLMDLLTTPHQLFDSVIFSLKMAEFVEPVYFTIARSRLGQAIIIIRDHSKNKQHYFFTDETLFIVQTNIEDNIMWSISRRRNVKKRLLELLEQNKLGANSNELIQTRFSKIAQHSKKLIWKICTKCNTRFRVSLNVKGEWHDRYDKCSTVKCGWNLGLSKIGKYHWSCCFNTNFYSFFVRIVVTVVAFLLFLFLTKVGCDFQQHFFLFHLKNFQKLNTFVLQHRKFFLGKEKKGVNHFGLFYLLKLTLLNMKLKLNSTLTTLKGLTSRSYMILQRKRFVTKKDNVPTFGSIINGKEEFSNDKNEINYLSAINPSNNKKFAQFEICNEKLLNECITSAKKVWDNQWKKTRIEERKEIISKYSGKPIWESINDIKFACDIIDYYIEISDNIIKDEKINNNIIRKEPYGVIASIGAWNFPLQIAIYKIFPALLMGNCVIYKPSEHTCLTTHLMGKIAQECGMPEGVLNIIYGDGRIGKKLTENNLIDKITFTGSEHTAHNMMANIYNQRILPATLELGGKSPLIIFDDYPNIKDAVSCAMLANYYSCGQVCSNGTRVYVHYDILDSFLENLLQQISLLKIDNPCYLNTHIGPLIHKNHLQKVLDFIQRAKKDNFVHLIYGGNKYNGYQNKLKDGCFIEPTVFIASNKSSDINYFEQNIEIVKEEIFGPVMTILPFKTESE
ncbi:betaine aldehyde dehydrogenase, partial [Reticulomyxa filosa]